jgi:Holliday junction resolvasome RuvABC endonuclease subunit
MKVLGLDVALRRTGWALIDGDLHGVQLVERGVIDAKGEQPEALAYLLNRAGNVMARLQPDVVYVEVPGRMNKHMGRTVATIVALARAAGAVLIAAFECKVRAVEIEQNTVKLMLGRYARRSKEGMHAVLGYLASAGILRGYSTPRRPRGGVDTDQDDALCIALAGLTLELHPAALYDR